MPLNSTLIGVFESEFIFVPIDSEVEYYGQPCGMIVAKTMALAHSAAAKVEITYERTQLDRPIIPSLRHWREYNKLSACPDTHAHIIPANQTMVPPLVGVEKNIKGNIFEENRILNLFPYQSFPGDFEFGAQYHMTMEPQTAFCTPSDDGGINLNVSSQWLDVAHIASARSLKIPQSKIITNFKVCVCYVIIFLSN